MTISAIASPTYQPAMRIVTAITNANPASVTTSFAHNYNSNLIVRIDIPLGFGMQQINQQVGTITVTGTTTFTINIDTTKYDAFSTSTIFPYNDQLAQVIPIGETSDTLINATVNVLV